MLASACALISFYFASAERLTSEERLFAAEKAGSRLQRFRALPMAAFAGEEWRISGAFLTIDLTKCLRETTEHRDRLTPARDPVVSDPRIFGGTLVIRGTRIPVYDAVASAAAGIPIERILIAYPLLDAEQIELAAL